MSTKDDSRAGFLRRWYRGTEGAPMPRFGTPDFARWLNGDVTRFCGHGYHEGSDKGPLRCEGTIRTLGIAAPCLCECHR